MSSPRATRVHDHGTAQAPSRTESTTEPGVAARPMLAVGWSLYGAPWLQLVAINGKSEGQKTSQDRCRPLRPVAARSNGKAGVDGSSPSEGSAKGPQTGVFDFGSSCKRLAPLA